MLRHSDWGGCVDRTPHDLPNKLGVVHGTVAVLRICHCFFCNFFYHVSVRNMKCYDVLWHCPRSLLANRKVPQLRLLQPNDISGQMSSGAFLYYHCLYLAIPSPQ